MGQTLLIFFHGPDGGSNPRFATNSKKYDRTIKIWTNTAIRLFALFLEPNATSLWLMTYQKHLLFDFLTRGAFFSCLVLGDQFTSFGPFTGGSGCLENCSYACPQFADIDGLGHIYVTAGIQRLLSISFECIGRYSNNRYPFEHTVAT